MKKGTVVLNYSAGPMKLAIMINLVRTLEIERAFFWIRALLPHVANIYLHVYEYEYCTLLYEDNR